MTIRLLASAYKQSGQIRLLKILLSAMAVAGLILALGTPFFGGIGWDGLYEVELSALLLNTPSDPTSLQALREAWAPQDLSKGPLLFWLAQAIGAATPLPNWSGNPLDVHNYELLGVSSVVLGFVGVAILAGSLAYVVRSRLLGLVVLSLTLTLPLWVGLSGLDYRDTQVASGLAAVTGAGLLTAMAPSLRRSWYSIVGFAAIGGLLAVGSRSGSVLLLGAVVSWVALATIIGRKSELARAIGLSATLVGGTVIGSGLAVLTHPLGRAEPVSWLSDAVRLASDHPNVMLVRVLGQNVTSNESPWWYVPAWLLAQLPLVTSVVFAAIILGAFALRPHVSWSSPEARALVVLCGPAILIPLALVAAGPNLFDGIRHLLFIIPPLFALMGTLAWSLISRRIPRIRVGKIIGQEYVAWVFISLVALSLFATARWFPYSYAFVNPVAGIIKEPRVWEYDYWGSSSREAISRLREDYDVDAIFVRPSESSARPFGGMTYEEFLDRPAGKWGGVTFFRFDAELPSECNTVFTIRRDGIPLARAGVCS